MKNKFKKTSSHSTGLNILSFTQMVLAFIVIAWLNHGIFTYAMPYVHGYIKWGLFMAWFGLALTVNKKFAKTFCIQCWPLLFFYFYITVISLFVKKDLGPYIGRIEIPSPSLLMIYSIFLYYFDGKYRRFQKFLSVFLFLDCVVVAINTYIHLQMNPLIARYLAAGEGTEARESLLGIGAFYGVGGYGYFYSLVSIILLLGFLFLNYPKKYYLVLLLILAFTALLIQASYMISIALTFLFLALLVIMHYTNKYTFIAITLLIVIMLLIFQGTFASMFEKLADIEGIPHMVSSKLNELAIFFSGNDISGTDINVRQNLYSQSIDAFANNILTGTVLTNSNVYSAGNHAAWLDLLADFGLFSIPFFIFWFRAYKYCKNKVPLIFRPFVTVYWLYYVCLGFINTLDSTVIYTTWLLFLPLFISSFFKTNEKSAV